MRLFVAEPQPSSNSNPPFRLEAAAFVACRASTLARRMTPGISMSTSCRSSLRTFQELIAALDRHSDVERGRDSADNSGVAALRRPSRRSLVVDGGSVDEPSRSPVPQGPAPLWPRAAGERSSPPGAAAAAGDWLLFLHADCRLGAGLGGRGRDVILSAAPRSGDRAGYFDLALDDASPAARRLERIVAWRCRVLALPYGDQGLLISRTLYEAVGGFAPLPLMEDVDLARRLGRRRLTRIGGRCVASRAALPARRLLASAAAQPALPVAVFRRRAARA